MNDRPRTSTRKKGKLQSKHIKKFKFRGSESINNLNNRGYVNNIDFRSSCGKRKMASRVDYPGSNKVCNYLMKCYIFHLDFLSVFILLWYLDNLNWNTS